MIDVSTLTLGEVDKIETLSGQSIGLLGEDDTPKGKMMAALAFVIKRRQQMAAGEKMTFTWNDALGLTMSQAQEILGIEDEGEPADGVDAQESIDAEPLNAAAAEAEAMAWAEGADPDPTPGE